MLTCPAGSSMSVPVASLSSLPLELKARIVDLARLQDAQFHDRKEAGSTNQKLAKLIKSVTTPWHGKSLARCLKSTRNSTRSQRGISFA